MSRRDTYHDTVKRALVNDGWTITHDPLRLSYEGASVSTDLGAEKVSAGEQRIAVEIIAVEVKDFDGEQMMSQFEKALGQYNLYRSLLRVLAPDRTIFLAVRLFGRQKGCI
ncbi:MAG TPA: element excision factor XisH family protein [Blastocatellia bacterium]|nr:element excision factor XisH family protein [Blastocatellia bacterium]HMX24486.1 element excision factor XisH family protein [Blastocatellia bacterium]HMY73207.1 element excision factor XisH family protein [Blastocatellia bacterium]HMZ22045.1 element excision factor XisH family protein [Blastocatellia bacterium]HNG30058.1 element excision factor XisH family protein [Blastocatellia bacterium]